MVVFQESLTRRYFFRASWKVFLDLLLTETESAQSSILFPSFCSCLVAFDINTIFWLHSCLCTIYAAAPAIINQHQTSPTESAAIRQSQSGNRTSQSWRRRWFSCLLAIVFAPGAKKLNAKLHSLIRIRSL